MKLKPLVAGLALAATVIPTAYADYGKRGAEMFRHIATFDVTRNKSMVDGEEIVSEVAEIVDVTKDGKTLIYTDSETGNIGFVDISYPRDPRPDGLLDVRANIGEGRVGEPTSVAVRGRYALVGLNTSATVTCTLADDPDETISIITDWTGQLVVVDIPKRVIVKRIELGGQPDSVAVSPDGRYAAVAVENERNEDASDGIIPQGRDSTLVDAEECEFEAEYDLTTNPAVPGKLVIVDLKGYHPHHWSTRDVELAGLPGMFAAEDPEPEFVDINHANLAAVTLQENNHLAIVNLRSGKVVKHFPAGEVDLMDVDTVEDDLIILDSEITKRREPDAITWLGKGLFAIANEGDYEDENGDEGGSRGFTVFNKAGKVVFESFESFEHLLVSAGHYNEGRSENKGVEPEAVEYGRYGRDELLFVASERSNAVGVYQMRGAKPKLLQALPTGIGPEGLKAIPQRNLFIASTETAVFDAGIPTMINIYQRKKGPGNYPQIASANDDNDLPIPWVALSDLVGDPEDAHTLYAVSDSFLAEGFIYKIDVSERPALITERYLVDTSKIPVELFDGQRLDLEGIAVGPQNPDGRRSFWLGSEGQAPDPDDPTDPVRENLVLKVNVDLSSGIGVVEEAIALPEDLVDQRRGNGIEGIAVTGEAGSEVVSVVIQRAWPKEGDTDKVNTKIGRYDVETGQWTFVHYPLEAEGDGDWIGLSGITAMPNGKFWVIERDKGWGPSSPPNAELKAIFEVDLAAAADRGDFKPYVQPLPGEEADLETIEKTLVRNLTATIAANSIWTAEKLEGFAISADHQLYAVTDNDGVDDAPGETVFLHLGDYYSFGNDAKPPKHKKWKWWKKAWQGHED